MSINRIINGEEAVPNEYPWIVALFHEEYEHQCGGSILSSKHVLTAAHCFYFTSEDGLKTTFLPHTEWIVRIGEHNKNQSTATQNISIAEKGYIEHPDFDIITATSYDIAILKLASPIIFSEVVVPICLPADTSTQYNDKIATVAGWGLFKLNHYSFNNTKIWAEKDTYPNILQTVKLNVISNTRCREITEGRIELACCDTTTDPPSCPKAFPII